MSLEHFHLFAILEAHDEIRCDGLLNRHRRIAACYRSGLAAARLGKRPIDLPDQLGSSAGVILLFDTLAATISLASGNSSAGFMSAQAKTTVCSSPPCYNRRAHSPGIYHTQIRVQQHRWSWRRKNSTSCAAQFCGAFAGARVKYPPILWINMLKTMLRGRKPMIPLHSSICIKFRQKSQTIEISHDFGTVDV
jgi:hypothetical protein